MLFDEMTAVLDPEPHGAALNMAIDEVLLRGAAGPLLRVYRWAQQAVSFGYFGKYEEVERAWPGRELIRRWTGGGVVPHGADVTYTLVVPAAHPFARRPARESYRLIHEEIAARLRASGVAAVVAPAAQAKISEACFENPAASDILANGRKIAGAAQRRASWGLLHQGSIQAAAGFAAALAPAFAQVVPRREIRSAELTQAAEVAAEKYATAAWLRRR
jgi:lipoate-protein ligase A